MKVQATLILTLALASTVFAQFDLFGSGGLFGRSRQTEYPEHYVAIGSSVSSSLLQVPGSQFFRNTIEALGNSLNAYEKDVLKISKLDVSNLSSSAQNAVRSIDLRSIRDIGDGFRRLISKIPNMRSLTELPAEIRRANLLDQLTEQMGNIVLAIRNGVSPTTLVPESIKAALGILPAMGKDLIHAPLQFMSLLTGNQMNSNPLSRMF